MRERQQAATDAALARLRKSGKLRNGSQLAPVEMPRPFAEALARVMALEAGTPRLSALESHYLDLMPALRAEQLCTSEAPANTFFQAPLRWDNLPHLSAAIARLRTLLAEVGAPPLVTDGETLGDLYQSTFYGGFMPLLYGAPGDLAHFARAPGTLDAVIDRYLAAPLIHELSHLSRDRRVFPLYLDECVAGWLGVRVLPEFAYPRHDEGLYATPWFSQVGQALARVAGPRNLLSAHAGVLPWEEALPRGLATALARLGWEDYVESRRLHLLSDNFHPEPWLKLFFLAAAELPLSELSLTQLRELPWREVPPGAESKLDAELVRDGLNAMCLRNYQEQGSFRVQSRPPPSLIVIDAANCRMSTPGGAHDPVPLAYLFPPAIAARLPHDYAIQLRELAAIDELSRAILDGAPSRETAGYTLTAVRRR